MTNSLFAERFTTAPAAPPAGDPPASWYDDSRCYSLTADGSPLVELESPDSTTTMTFTEAESSDSDRAWAQAFADTDTVTKATSDRDHWQE